LQGFCPTVAHAARAEGVAHRTWLTGVLRNVAWKERRAGARRRAREERGARGESLPSTGELVARADMQRALSEAIVALAEPFRTAILLRYMEDLSGAEIARRQGVPEGTVRWRVKRGLELLREALEGRRGSDWLHSCALVAGLVRAPEGAAVAAAAGTSALTLKGAGLLAAGLTLAGGTTAIGAAWIGTAEIPSSQPLRPCSHRARAVQRRRPRTRVTLLEHRASAQRSPSQLMRVRTSEPTSAERTARSARSPSASGPARASPATARRPTSSGCSRSCAGRMAEWT
jgi:hypothetical protein